jgi:hypothetical protein
MKGVAGPSLRPRAGSSAKALLLTVLGELVLPHDGVVWTATLVAALTGLDVEEKNARQAIARLAVRQSPLSSMGVDVADVNRDGFDDIYVVDMLSPDHVRRNTQRVDLRSDRSLPGEIRMEPASWRKGARMGQVSSALRASIPLTLARTIPRCS